jgi:hypothetical protein
LQLTSCEGVAYSKGPEWPDPKAIQQWPGTFGGTLVNKVKTAVCYDINSDGLASWGYQCDPSEESLEYNELFKLYLDPMYKDQDAPPYEEVQRWFCDYLKSLYKYIVTHLQERDKQFHNKRVDFVFSVPTTWKHPGTHANIERLIKSAGFGKSSNHTVAITLTEAEAAAVSASKQQMHRDEVFLVCDAGGGTTDLNVLKVVSAAKNSTQLEPLSSNEVGQLANVNVSRLDELTSALRWQGRSVGSTLIDHRVETKIVHQLRLVEQHLTNNANVESVVAKMMRDRYETFKCNLGEGMNVQKVCKPAFASLMHNV